MKLLNKKIQKIKKTKKTQILIFQKKKLIK